MTISPEQPSPAHRGPYPPAPGYAHPSIFPAPAGYEQPNPAYAVPHQRTPGPFVPHQRPAPGHPAPAQPAHPVHPGADPTDTAGARIGQFVVDFLLFCAACLAIWLVTGLLSLGAIALLHDVAAPVALGLVIVAYAAYLAAGWGIFAWWPSRHRGQTPAMGWMNLRVVTDRGAVPTLGALSLRWLLYLVDFSLIGVIVMCATQRHQRVGDLAARTLVVRS